MKDLLDTLLNVLTIFVLGVVVICTMAIELVDKNLAIVIFVTIAILTYKYLSSRNK